MNLLPFFDCAAGSEHKVGPRNNPELAMLYDKEKQKDNANRATLAVARKLVAYLMAVDRGQRNFQIAEIRSNIAE